MTLSTGVLSNERVDLTDSRSFDAPADGSSLLLPVFSNLGPMLVRSVEGIIIRDQPPDDVDVIVYPSQQLAITGTTQLSIRRLRPVTSSVPATVTFSAAIQNNEAYRVDVTQGVQVTVPSDGSPVSVFPFFVGQWRALGGFEVRDTTAGNPTWVPVFPGVPAVFTVGGMVEVRRTGGIAGPSFDVTQIPGTEGTSDPFGANYVIGKSPARQFTTGATGVTALVLPVGNLQPVVFRWGWSALVDVQGLAPAQLGVVLELDGVPQTSEILISVPAITNRVHVGGFDTDVTVLTPGNLAVLFRSVDAVTQVGIQDLVIEAHSI